MRRTPGHSGGQAPPRRRCEARADAAPALRLHKRLPTRRRCRPRPQSTTHAFAQCARELPASTESRRASFDLPGPSSSARLVTRNIVCACDSRVNPNCFAAAAVNPSAYWRRGLASLTSGSGRACVKTPPLRNFGGRLTLGEVEKIAPSAIWRLDISSHSTRSAFSHSLGRE